MRGQWRGEYKGDNSGTIVVEFDDSGNCFEGSAYLYESDASLPCIHASIRTASKDSKQSVIASLLAIDPATGLPAKFETISERFPRVEFSKTANVEIECDSAELYIRWKTSLGFVGEARLPKSRSTQPSDCRVKPITNWAEFKEYAANLEPHRLIFRGQSAQWRLRSRFHRSGRVNLDRYLNKDIPTVHRHLSAVTSHKFDLRDPLQHASFYSLIQHHGFPTPFLDWTYSPFVAARFAFADLSSKHQSTEFVRIYVFDREQWCNDFRQVQNTSDRRPHFSIIEALALENTRSIPQQALSSFTNVDDVESYILECEKNDVEYLAAIDLPIFERAKVLKELRLMGVTHGSLFPGLDGTCSELRERFFPIIDV